MPSQATPPQGRLDLGGVDANATKTYLMDVAKQRDVTGRSRMNKDELVEAIENANRRDPQKRQPIARR